MWLSNTFSTRQLFVIYITISTLILGGIGGFVIYSQSVKVFRQMQQEAIAVELKTAKSYLLRYINDQETMSRRLAELPQLIKVAQSVQPVSDTAQLSNELQPFHFNLYNTQIAIYNHQGRVIYNQLSDFLVNNPHAVGRILNGRLNDSLLQLKQRQHQIFFMFYLPIKHRQQIIGVLGIKFNFDSSAFFNSIVNNSSRWIGLTQPSSGVELFPRNRQRWRLYHLPLGYGDLMLNYAINIHSQIEQRDQLLYRLASMLLLGFSIALLLIYLLGERLLVRPFVELKRNREQLRERTYLLSIQEARAKQLAQVAEHAHDSIVICNAHGAITWVNKAFIKSTQYDKAEVIGLNPGELLSGPDSDHLARIEISEKLAKHQRIRKELLNYRKDGSTFWADIDITPVLSENNELESFIAVQRDITQQRDLEESLRQALSRANEANQAKLRFLAQMSHEIRTPMNGVLGIAQLLEQTSLSEQQRSYLSDLYHSGQHMMALLNDILDFSKINTQQVQLEKVAFALPKLLQEIQSTYHALSEQQGLQFIVSNKISHPYIIADRARIRQIITNLVSNAIKFTHHGHVKLTLKNIISHNQLYLVIRVQDTGIGVASMRQEQIFEAFSQAESSTTRLYGGSGLGLAIVQQLCKAMNGQVRVHSKPNKGSTFTATLEIRPTELPESRTVIPTSPRFQAQQQPLLIAEDNRTNAMIIKAFMSKRNFLPEVAVNGALALQQLHHQRYPIILMDNHMPEIDGIEATRQIRRFPAPQCFSLIIGCTADVYGDAHEEMMAAGVNAILTKPLQNEAIDEQLFAVTDFFDLWATWHKEGAELTDINWCENAHWLAQRPCYFQTIAIKFLKRQGFLWEQLNAHLVMGNFQEIIIRAEELHQYAKQLNAHELAQAAEQLTHYAREQQPPPMTWLAQYQHLQRNIDERLRQWLSRSSHSQCHSYS